MAVAFLSVCLSVRSSVGQTRGLWQNEKRRFDSSFPNSQRLWLTEYRGLFWVGQWRWSCTEEPQVEAEGEEKQTATKEVFFSVREWSLHGTSFQNMLLTLLRSTLSRSERLAPRCKYLSNYMLLSTKLLVTIQVTSYDLGECLFLRIIAGKYAAWSQHEGIPT